MGRIEKGWGCVFSQTGSNLRLQGGPQFLHDSRDGKIENIIGVQTGHRRHLRKAVPITVSNGAWGRWRKETIEETKRKEGRRSKSEDRIHGRGRRMRGKKREGWRKERGRRIRSLGFCLLPFSHP